MTDEKPVPVMHSSRLRAIEDAMSQLLRQQHDVARQTSQLGSVANEVNATLNVVMGLSQNLAGMPGVLGLIANQLNSIGLATNQIQASLSQGGSGDAATALLTAGIMARRQSDMAGAHSSEQRAIAQPLPHTIADDLERLRDLDTRLFPVWEQLYRNDTQSYESNLEASASVWGHKYAELFGAYFSVHARGRTLDVGCGINGKPSYLGNHPNALIAGIEPRECKSDPGFLVVQGFNEFLPWANGTFDTVVSGTSLDHVLSIEKSLEEVCRILAPGGRYLVWLASIAGSPAYAPTAPDFKPADQFHLFHFDRKWIEPVFAKYFDFADVSIFPQPGFDHVFYCLTPKSA